MLGLFNYPPRDVGPDTTHEIDIEFARWGRADASVGNFTVWPAKDELKQTSHTFDVRLNGNFATHRFDWQRDRIMFASMHGHTGDSEQPISRWLFDRQPVADYISAAPMPIASQPVALSRSRTDRWKRGRGDHQDVQLPTARPTEEIVSQRLNEDSIADRRQCDPGLVQLRLHVPAICCSV